MLLGKSFHGFQFHNELVFHEQIQSVNPDRLTSISKGDLLLRFKPNALMPQFDFQSSMIHTLKKPWPQLFVDLDHATDDLIG